MFKGQIAHSSRDGEEGEADGGVPRLWALDHQVVDRVTNLAARGAQGSGVGKETGMRRVRRGRARGRTCSRPRRRRAGDTLKRDAPSSP